MLTQAKQWISSRVTFNRAHAFTPYLSKILILSFLYWSGLPTSFFHSAFHSKISYAFLYCHRTTRPAHFILLDSYNRMLPSEQNKVCGVSRILSILSLRPLLFCTAFSAALCSQTPSILAKVGNQVPRPYTIKC